MEHFDRRSFIYQTRRATNVVILGESMRCSSREVSVPLKRAAATPTLNPFTTGDQIANANDDISTSRCSYRRLRTETSRSSIPIFWHKANSSW